MHTVNDFFCIILFLNHSNKITVRFWDDFGQCFYNALSQASILPPVVIIAYASMKRNSYTGITHLSNVPATEFCINPDCERADAIRRRLNKCYDFANASFKEQLLI